jgi:hypothetical protein
MVPVDYNSIYPELNGYLIKPLLVNPPMCKLHELQDGTYALKDLEIMHQVMEIKRHAKQIASPDPQQSQPQLN